jgi:hypothetical protein
MTQQPPRGQRDMSGQAETTLRMLAAAYRSGRRDHFASPRMCGKCNSIPPGRWKPLGAQDGAGRRSLMVEPYGP